MNKLSENQLENQVLGMAMRRPTNTEVVTVKPDYFTNSNTSKAYSAVQSKPELASPFAWFRIAVNKYHYNGSAKILFDIQKAALAPYDVSTFKAYVKSLHRNYLGRKINQYAIKFKDSHDKKDYEYLMQFAAAYEDIDLDNDSHGISSAVQQAIYNTQHVTPNGLDTGYKELDYCLGKGLTGDTLMTIGADTNVGKTAMAVNIASNVLQRAKHPVMVDYFTEEMSNLTILNRFISCRTGVSDWQLMDPKKRVDSKATLENIAKTAYELPKQGLRTYEGLDLTQIVSTIRRHASQRKPNTYIAIIDHIGIVDVPNMARMPRYLQVGMVSRRLKELTTKFNIPIIMQSQVNRQVAGRDSNELVLSDLNESSATAQDSNLVVLLYKDKKDDKSHRMVKVAKNRNGLTAKIPFKFDGARMKFTELKE